MLRSMKGYWGHWGLLGDVRGHFGAMGELGGHQGVWGMSGVHWEAGRECRCSGASRGTGSTRALGVPRECRGHMGIH